MVYERNNIMKKIILYFMAIMIGIFLMACDSKDNDKSFEVYLIEYTGDNWIDNVDEFVLSDKPLFTDEDIIEYNWSNHQIILKDEFLEKLSKNNKETTDTENFKNAAGGSKLFNTVQRDYFVVVVNDKKIYYGNFKQSVLSSYMNPSAIMLDTPTGIIIDLSKRSEDVRNNKEIYSHILSIFKYLIYRLHTLI